MTISDEELKVHLNAETGKLTWGELQTHFARGIVIKVAPEMDLVLVAMSIVKDDKVTIQDLMDTGKIIRANDSHGRIWAEKAANFWAVVTPPWVLVQEVESE